MAAPDEDQGADALVALELRLRFLETLLAGSPEDMDRASAGFAPSGSVGARATATAEQMQDAMRRKGAESVRRFVDAYDQNAPLLHLPMPSPVEQPDASKLGLAERTALALESEADIRSIERGLRELEGLNQRDAAGAGRLTVCESLAPELKPLASGLPAHDAALASLEDRTATVLARYDAYVDTLSQLFISWDHILTAAETEVTKLERRAADED